MPCGDLVVYLVISDSFELQICLDKESKSNITILIRNGGLSELLGLSLKVLSTSAGLEHTSSTMEVSELLA